MAPHHLLSLLVFTSLIFLFTNPSLSFSDNNVNLSLYYESLCPYCKGFIVQQLVNLFNTDLISIVNLRLIPWGNSQVIKPSEIIICQHGEDECYLNTIHACVINIWPDPKKHFGFIYCVESGGVNIQQYSEQAEAVWKLCSQKLSLDQKSIKNCYDSGYGQKLILQYAKETAHLNPLHTYVPWVTVNNQPVYNDYANFVAYICEAYKGKTVPKACISPSSSNSTKKENSIHQACYPVEARNLTLFNRERKY